MPNVVEEIPAELRPAADAALAWINREKGSQFRLTGLVDCEEAIGRGAGQPIELGLVLCKGEICRREQVRVEPTGAGFAVSAAEAETSLIPRFSTRRSAYARTGSTINSRSTTSSCSCTTAGCGDPPVAPSCGAT